MSVALRQARAFTTILRRAEAVGFRTSIQFPLHDPPMWFTPELYQTFQYAVPCDNFQVLFAAFHSFGTPGYFFLFVLPLLDCLAFVIFLEFGICVYNF